MSVGTMLKNTLRKTRKAVGTVATAAKKGYQDWKKTSVKSEYPSASQAQKIQSRDKAMEMLDKKRNKNGRLPN